MTRSSPTRSYGGQQAESFERFYMRNIAVNEGCGCAELMIRNYPSRTDGHHDTNGILALIWLLVRRIRAMARSDGAPGRIDEIAEVEESAS